MDAIVHINRNHALHPAQIILLEGRSNYTLIHFVGGRQELSSYNLKVYEQALTAVGFLRAHKSYLINPSCVKEYVQRLGETSLWLNNGMRIDIARRRFRSIRWLLVRSAA